MIDYKKYPPNWKSEIRPRILNRAKHCCEFCGVENYKEGVRSLKKLVTLEEYMEDHKDMHESKLVDKYGKWYNDLKYIKIILTIAHLDHDPENWDVKDERLRALCQKCHLRYDSKHRAQKRAVNNYKNSLFPIEK